MDVYVLDGQYRRNSVIDSYESLIWTERFRSFGEFELVLASTQDNRGKLRAGTWLAIAESKRTMKIETVQTKEMSTGETQLTVKGRTLEAFLAKRHVLRGGDDPQVTDASYLAEKWVETGLPADIARELFHQICVLGSVSTNDILPMAVEGSPVGMFPADTIPEPDEVVTIEFEPQSLYTALTDKICSVYDLGFRLVRAPEQPYLYFDVYSGSDRTSQNPDLPTVLFSSSLDNLQDTTELRSIADFANLAFVYCKDHYKFVYPDTLAVTPTGLDREIVIVSVDIPEGTSYAVAEPIMIQRGKEELAKHRIFEGFDGEVDQKSQYKYGVDYHLGDLVEMRSSTGAANIMRVMEQIFASDAEGTRSYPTLSINRYVQPGTWLAWNYNQHWVDLDADPMTWSEQP